MKGGSQESIPKRRLALHFPALGQTMTVTPAIVVTIGLPRRARQDWKALRFLGIIGFLRGFVSFR